MKPSEIVNYFLANLQRLAKLAQFGSENKNHKTLMLAFAMGLLNQLNAWLRASSELRPLSQIFTSIRGITRLLMPYVRKSCRIGCKC